MEVNGQTSLTHQTKSTKVEVSIPKVNIFKRAYFTATIIDTPPWATRNRHSNEYLVQYDNLLSTDGAKYLTEVCVVDMVMCKEEGKKYLVRFDQNPSSHYMDVAHDYLRLHFDWVGDK
ncbi:hypothetical protein ACFE04_000307 [Oxalis oulophora]